MKKKEKDRQADRQTDRLIDRQTDRHTGRQTHRQTDRQTDRQSDKQTNSGVFIKISKIYFPLCMSFSFSAFPLFCSSSAFLVITNLSMVKMYK